MALHDRALTSFVASGVRPTNIDLTNFDLAAMADSELGRTARSTLGLAAGALRETTYIGVGFTVLGLQRLQVRRREFERAVRR